MSSTRYAKPGSPLSQGRFASSPALNNGLRGNLVALRCATIDSREDRELIWALQYLSYGERGLEKITAGLLEKFGDRLGTRHMIEFGVKPGKSYNAEQVKAIRGELKSSAHGYPLRGELSEAGTMAELCGSGSECDALLAEARREAARRPVSYPVENFLDECKHAARDLEADLKKLCLDPAAGFDSIWYFYELRECLLEYQKSELLRTDFAPTELSKAIWSEIDDVYEMGGFVLLHNSAGNGKSFAAKTWSEANPGRGRYVLTPATNLEIDFWRCIAEAMGTADGLSYKCEQIRTRAKNALLASGLVLVIDSAQFLFPVADYRYALPSRLNQVLELAELGVSVVMISDSKLFDTLGFVEARTGWNRNKFVNQLSNVVELPATLQKEDVLSVAAALLPDGDRAAQRKLADYMIVAPGYLHSGEVAAKRARRLAVNSDCINLADMNRVIEIAMVPGLKALKSGLKRADAAAGKCKAKVRNWRPETPAQLAAKSGHRRNQIVTSSDMKRPAMAPQAADAEVAETDFRRSGTNRIGTPNAVTSRRQIAPDLVTA